MNGQNESEPFHTRDKDGRHKVDLRNIKSPLIRYGLAGAVLGFVLLLVTRAPKQELVSDTTIESWIPYVGFAVVALIALGVILGIMDKRK